MNFNSLAVKEIKKETQDAVSILFEVPEHLLSNYTFVSGQYITIKTTIENSEIRRDYSLCTTPKSGELKVVVKAVENGLFSKYANEQLTAGAYLEVSEPQGRFTYTPKNKEHTIFCIAAGSGITPIMSIVKEALETSDDATVAMIYGNKSEAQTIFYEDLLALKASYNERFILKFVFSEETRDEALFGRIDTPKIKYMLNHISVPDLSYICGPEPMIMEAKEALMNQGFDEASIKFELFTASAQKEDSSASSQIQAGTAQITVLVDDEEATFIMPNSKTILEEALANDLDAPYSCQGGICSSCIARVTEGEVKMRQNNILTDSEIAEGLVLTCQAEPVTSVVKIDYDDV